MYEFAEFWDSLDQVTADELSNPFWRVLAGLGLQLYFEYSVWKSLHVFRRQL